MGTRADFYIGLDCKAEWLGSIAYDGYPGDSIPDSILKATAAEDFRAAVLEFLKGRDDGTLPEFGWPWPWKSSATTDYSYAWHNDTVWIARGGWSKAGNWNDDQRVIEFPENFPDMSDRQNVTLGKRSGVMILRR